MPVSHEDHGGVPMTVSVALGCLDQLFNLGLGQVLPAAELAVRPANWANCSFFGDWRDQLQVRFSHGFRLLAINDCSYNTCGDLAAEWWQCLKPGPLDMRRANDV